MKFIIQSISAYITRYNYRNCCRPVLYNKLGLFFHYVSCRPNCLVSWRRMSLSPRYWVSSHEWLHMRRQPSCYLWQSPLSLSSYSRLTCVRKLNLIYIITFFIYKLIRYAYFTDFNTCFIFFLFSELSWMYKVRNKSDWKTNKLCLC